MHNEPATPLTGSPPNLPGHNAGHNAEHAVTALYHAHALELFRIAMATIGDRQAAEDSVQDAFMALYYRWDRLREPDKALAYLRVSVLNGCRTRLRKRRHALYQHEPVPTASAEQELLRLEWHPAVLAALRKLPRRQREALVLRYVLDLSQQDTAEIMHVSCGTVKSSASRGSAALERLLRSDTDLDTKVHSSADQTGPD